MPIIYMVENSSIYTGQYEDKEGFGKCYICGVHGHITYIENNKGQIIPESRECDTCKTEWKAITS